MNVVLVGLIQALEFLFIVGIFGSLVVILLAGIEDVETIFDRKEEPESQPTQPTRS
jgi:hypothetical protein